MNVRFALVSVALAVGCATTTPKPSAAASPTLATPSPAATAPVPTAVEPTAAAPTPAAPMAAAPAAAASAAAAPTAVTPTAAAPTGPTTPTVAAGKPRDAKSLLRASMAEVGKGHLAQARALWDEAQPLIGADHDLELRAVSVAIAVFSNLGDYEGAARAVLATIRRRNGDRSDRQLFLFHNWMAILREAEGDLPGAILESAARTAIGYEGSWEPAAERLQQARFKDDWHRAYLFRMYAEQLSGTQREGALLAAESARKDYVAAGGYPDSIAVLDALFAMYDHRWDDVRAAVRRVDVAKDGDEEDLYILFAALDAAGDQKGAAAIRRQIEKDPPTWNIWRTWLKSDTDGSPASAKRFSPRYPTGKRP